MAYLSRDAAINARLNTILGDAAKVFQRAATASRNKAWSKHHETALQTRISIVSGLMADCRDGRWYGMVDVATQTAMGNFITESEALITMNQPRRRSGETTEKEERIAYGWLSKWRITRALKINGSHYEKVVEVRNPAVGRMQLNEWEQSLRSEQQAAA